VLHRSVPRLRGQRTVARLACAWLALITELLCWPRSAVAAKTDVLVLRNGDRVTGEVKGLARGKLDYSTDDAGRLSVEWVKVARLTSRNSFDALDSDGKRHFGRLDTSAADGFVVFANPGADTLAIGNVIGITPIEATLIQRLSAYLDVGFSLAKANQASTFSLAGQVEYRGPAMGTQVSYDSYAQGQESVQTTTRNTLRSSVSWYLQQRWSAVALGQFEQNEELDLDHRLSLGGAANRMLRHTNQMELTLGAGLVGTQEQFSTESSDKTSLEALVAANWDVFHFDSPKLDFSTEIAVFPSLSQTGRVRGQGNFRLVYELFKDFNTGLRLTDTFDSKPPGGATKNDYVTELTIGWSYHR
jgi:hypothetical protein